MTEKQELTIDRDTVLALAVAISDRLAARFDEWQVKRFFTVKQAAIYSALSSDSIRNLLAAGKLTPLRPVRGRIIIDRRELDALILSSTGRQRRGRGIRKPE